MTGFGNRLKGTLRRVRHTLTAGTQASAEREIFADAVKNPTASEFEVDLWSLSRFVIARLVPVIGVHPYPLNEQLLAVAAVCRLKPRVVFDWGTYHGASARLFWESAKAFRLEYEIHSIDLPPEASHVEHPGDLRGRLVRGLPGLHLHVGDGVSVALEQWMCLGRPARPLFMVDGDHAYSSVAGELRRIFDAIPDASALVHDTFLQSPESGYNIGPAEAVREVVAARPQQFQILHSGLGLPGMTLLASKTALASIAGSTA